MDRNVYSTLSSLGMIGKIAVAKRGRRTAAENAPRENGRRLPGRGKTVDPTKRKPNPAGSKLARKLSRGNTRR